MAHSLYIKDVLKLLFNIFVYAYGNVFMFLTFLFCQGFLF